MMLPRTDAREADLVEFMDCPDCDPVRLARTYRAFGVVNRWVGRWGTIVRESILPLVRAHAASGVARPFRILDVGAGGGDLLRRIRTLTGAMGFPLELVGVDPDPRAIQMARSLTSGGAPPIRWMACRAEDLFEAGDRYDVVVSNHVLHHLTDGELTPFLETLEGLATRRAVVTDIARSRLGYLGFAMASRLFFPGTFIHADGLLSIRRSFRPHEILPHLPGGWQVRTLAPYRLVLTRDFG